MKTTPWKEVRDAKLSPEALERVKERARIELKKLTMPEVVLEDKSPEHGWRERTIATLDGDRVRIVRQYHHPSWAEDMWKPVEHQTSSHFPVAAIPKLQELITPK